MLHSAQEVYNYSGIYISYSLSSSSNALKVEPYLITLPTATTTSKWCT